MKTSTTSVTPVSTTDLMLYDGEYKTDFDKFRDMSGPAQAAIIGAGVIVVIGAGYMIYKGVEYFKDKEKENKTTSSNNTMDSQQYQYPQQYYQNPMQQSAVNIQGQYTTNENNQPTVAFQANSTPVAPQMQYQQQPQQYYRIVTPDGQVQDVPVYPQQPQPPIYQQPAPTQPVQ